MGQPVMQYHSTLILDLYVAHSEVRLAVTCMLCAMQALDGNAGGVFFQPWSSSMPSGSVMLYLTNSTFHSNSGRLGGGIFMLVSASL